jgi:hypothetical protein
LHSARRRSAPKMSYLGRCPLPCHRITKRSQFSSQFAQSETTYTHPNEAACRKLTPPGVRPKSALADIRTGVVRGDLRNEAIFPPNPHKRKPLAPSGAKPPTRAQTGRRREPASWWLGPIAVGSRVRIGRQFYATTRARVSFGRRVRKWLRRRGKQIEIVGHNLCRSAVQTPLRRAMSPRKRALGLGNRS